MNKTITASLILLSVSALSIAETQLTLSPALLHFDYTEFSTVDKVLDREQGWLPGLQAKLSYSISPCWLIHFNSAFYQSTVNYNGQTNTGVPLTSSTDTKLFRFGGRIEKNIINNTNLFIGAQSHKWRRNIRDNNNISGIDETYKWMEYTIGFNSDIFISSKSTLNIEAAYLITRNGTINVDLSRINYGFAKLDLGDGTGGRINLSWETSTENNTYYGLSLFYETWNFGRSNTKQTHSSPLIVVVTEPKSETRNAGLQFNIQYYF